MRIIAQGLSAILVTVGACSPRTDDASQHVWVTASSLGPSRVPYTPRPIITARETEAGSWIWQWEGSAPQTLSVEQLLGTVTAAQALGPKPLLLFSFTSHRDGSELISLRSRIATSAGCSEADPCIEGTREQLR
jgi:hypothetical protein